MPKTKKVWFVVADGARARILAKRAELPGFDTLDEFHSDDARKFSRELTSDKPGRGQESAQTGRRSGMEPTSDAHAKEKRVFARFVAGELNRAGQAKRFDELVLIAPTRALADIRDALDTQTKAKLAHEVAKDLTNMPQDQLAEHLGQIKPASHLA
jgi:protein required for attachment to host cells